MCVGEGEGGVIIKNHKISCEASHFEKKKTPLTCALRAVNEVWARSIFLSQTHMHAHNIFLHKKSRVLN